MKVSNRSLRNDKKMAEVFGNCEWRRATTSISMDSKDEAAAEDDEEEENGLGCNSSGGKCRKRSVLP